MAGNYTFSKNRSFASVINQGQIKAADGKYVALLGGKAVNGGVVIANQGTVVLGAGAEAKLDMTGDGLINMAVTKADLEAQVENKHLIQADGGLVVMTAKAAGDLTGAVVNNSGIIKAQGLVEKNGKIVLEGGTSGTVSVSGTLDTSGKDAGETGGTIKVLGSKLAITEEAKLDASGDKGGGTILVGGNYQGKGPEQNAVVTKVASSASINADAITSGSGGKVVVWADDSTDFAGTISAKGGASGGSGGSRRNCHRRIGRIK